MSDSEIKAKTVIGQIAKEVSPDATRKRIQRSIQLILESFAPDHVLTELLQNADDVEATDAEIMLTNEGMVFKHNGHEFTEPHLRALCDIGETTKKPGVHIGFMGIGFKATFKISDNVYVFSGPYRFFFTREEVIVPHWLDELSPDIHAHVEKGQTTFFLPFRQDLTLEIIKSLEETALTRLEPLCLVFLKNIEKVKIATKAGTRILIKGRESYSDNSQNKEKISVTEKRESKERIYNYLVFHKTLEIPESVKNDYRAKESRRADLKTTDVTLAFSLKDNMTEPVKSVLYTFLPTPFETGLRFTVNADFLLNTQRTEIDLVSRWNLWLLERVSIALIEIVHEFVQDKKQRLCVYDLLPRKDEVPEWLYAKIAVPLIGHMKDNPLILTAKENLALPSEVVLAPEDVQEIIPPEKANARYYVSARIRGKTFLKEEMNIQDLGEPLAERKFVLEALMDKTWLNSVDVKQIRAVYEFLYRKLYGNEEELWKLSWYEHSELEKRLGETEIVRSTNGQYNKAQETILPRKSRKQADGLVDLPCLVFVDPAVLSTTSLELLRKLGARDFSEESIINRILDSHGKEEWKKWAEEERLKSIVYIAKWLAKKNYQVQSEINDKLGGLALPIENGNWSSASTCYVPSPELKEVLPHSKYVDLSRIEGYVADIKPFLNTVGVLNFPRVLRLGERKQWVDTPSEILKANCEAYWSWLYREGHCTYEGRDHRISAYALDGFDECVMAKDINRLTKYLNSLLEHWHDYYKLHKDSRFRWFYYYDKSKDVPSYFAFQLKTHSWAPTTIGLVSPNEVFAPFREIKKVGGSLISYLKISEERAREKKEFLQFIGIQTEVSLQMLLSVLALARDVEVNDDLKAQLARIYQRMATLCEDETIDEEVYILDRTGNFQCSKNLYWLDDSEAESVFGDDIPAVWVPDNMSRPHIKALFSALGVTEVSSILERKRAYDTQETVEDIELKNELKYKSDYLYSVLQHYDSGKIERFPDFIRNLVVMKEKLLKIQLKVLDKVHEAEVPCFCSLEENRIYVSSDAQMTDVARELARSFKASIGSEFTLSFVLTQVPDIIVEQLRRSSIQLVPLAQPSEAEVSLGVEPELPAGPIECDSTPAIEPMVSELKKLPQTETLETPTPMLPTQEGENVAAPEVSVDIDKGELVREIEDMKQLLTEGKAPETEDIDVWRNPAEIEKVVCEPRVVVRPFVSASSKKNWELRTLDGEKVFVEIELDPSKLEAVRQLIKPFKERMRKIVEIMGGNPDTVNVCVAYPETDGDRREGQLFFNVLRNDKPLRWIVVAARELAYVKFPKPSQAHISLMTDLIEKVLERIQEVYPKIFSKERVT